MIEGDPRMQRLYVAHMLDLFPPMVRESLLSSETFMERYDIETDAQISLGRGNISFQRSVFFAVVRDLYAGEETLDVVSKEGTAFRASLQKRSDELVLVLAKDGGDYLLPSFWFLSPDAEYRLSQFDAEAHRRNLTDAAILNWRERVAEGPLEDDEIEAIRNELRLNPGEVAEAIGDQVRTGSSEVSLLVPRSSKYYERLVGSLGEGNDLKAFVDGYGSRHMSDLLDWDLVKGLKQVLMIAPQSSMASVVEAAKIDARIVGVFEWLADHGDRFSQIAGIELGLRLAERFRALEPLILRMIQDILSDDPNDKDGRLHLTASLVVFVDGELARTATLRGKAPFWRRLAAIAQASLIERELLEAGVQTSRFADWASEGRGQLFFLQTLIDLRLEPRWLPDFMSATQLKYEFVGRISAAGAAYGEDVLDNDLRALLRDGDGVRSKMISPFAFLPGPLEGGSVSPIAFPDDLAEEMHQPLGTEGITEDRLALIVNMALVFKITDEQARVVADTLRQAKHQVSIEASSDRVFSFLVGLATVSAVTRSTELANEVRILARVMRNRPGVDLKVDSLLRIGMIAAASQHDLQAWSSVVGEWLTEVSYEDLDRDTARAMRAHVRKLCQLSPILWNTSAKAEAGLAAVAGMAA